ncbi:MAG TPA: hypothetical protein DDX06_04450 [Curvibacter sp.]|nr:hypothetical protein [Curvibacter sp.]
MSNYRYVNGAQEVQAQLLAYPAKVEQRVVRNALAAGARVVRDAAKAEAPVRSGKLRGSIRVSTKARKGQVTAGVRVGNLKTGVFYAHMVLGGTKPHSIVPRRGKGLKVGNVPRRRAEHPGARPDDFMGRAKSSIGRALDTIVERARALIDKLNQEITAP